MAIRLYLTGDVRASLTAIGWYRPNGGPLAISPTAAAQLGLTDTDKSRLTDGNRAVVFCVNRGEGEVAKKPRQQLAKLWRPRLHKAVARERLFAFLGAALEHKPAICVVGPPGAGKTTLVASWLDARGVKGIWYQVDPGDADLATFFYYLGQATQRFSRKGQGPLPALTPEYLHDVEGFSRRFFREVFLRLPPRTTLVLDNYQEVAPDERFHEIVAQAVDEVPADNP